MKTRHDLLSELRRTMAGFVGEVFTEDMRQRIRMDAADLMNTAYDEGQSVMAPHVCANRDTPSCQLTDSDYDEGVCRKCNQDGGFEI